MSRALITQMLDCIATLRHSSTSFTGDKKAAEAMQAAREYLAAPEQSEPVTKWQDELRANHPNSDPQYWPDELMFKYCRREVYALRAQLAATPQPTTPEPVNQMLLAALKPFAVYGRVGSRDTEVAAAIAAIAAAEQAPQPAELTDEEINTIWSEPLERSKLSPFGMNRIRAILAAQKEKAK